MKTSTGLLAPLLLTVAAFGSEPSISFVNHVSLSPDSRFIAVIDSSNGRPSVNFYSSVERAFLFSISYASLKAYMDEPSVDAIDWSADAHLLKISANDRGEEPTILLVDPRKGPESLRRVLVSGKLASWGTWATTGHHLFVVQLDDNRIYDVDAATGSSTVIATNIHPATDLSVTGKMIVTKVENTDGVTYSLVAIDVRSHRVTVIAK